VKRLLTAAAGSLGAALEPERWAVAWKVGEATGSPPHEVNGSLASGGEGERDVIEASQGLLSGEYLLLQQFSGYVFVAMRQPIDL
jgi:hypothetical protein